MNQATITLFILVIAVLLFVSERLSLAVTAVGVSMALYLAGVISATDAFAGFVNPSVILFVGMFIVGGALFSTGVATKAGKALDAPCLCCRSRRNDHVSRNTT